MKILVFKEKHGDRYMKASTPEEVQESCLKVLRDRMEARLYCSPQAPQKPIYSKEEAEDILQEDYRKMALDSWRSYEKELKHYEAYKIWFDLATKEIKNPNGLASGLITRRDNYEYEGFEIVEVE